MVMAKSEQNGHSEFDALFSNTVLAAVSPNTNDPSFYIYGETIVYEKIRLKNEMLRKPVRTLQERTRAVGLRSNNVHAATRLRHTPEDSSVPFEDIPSDLAVPGKMIHYLLFCMALLDERSQVPLSEASIARRTRRIDDTHKQT